MQLSFAQLGNILDPNMSTSGMKFNRHYFSTQRHRLVFGFHSYVIKRIIFRRSSAFNYLGFICLIYNFLHQYKIINFLHF